MDTETPSMTRPDERAKLRYLSDRQDILDCLARVSRGIDRFDRELFLSAFHSDASVQFSGHASAPEELFERVTANAEGVHFSTLHNYLNHTCDIAGNVAHCETYFIFLGRNRDETNLISAGRYVDRLERRADQWKIALRCTMLECAGVIQQATLPFVDKLFDHSDKRWTACRTKDDPSYRRH